jgi:hypothetical protein
MSAVATPSPRGSRVLPGANGTRRSPLKVAATALRRAGSPAPPRAPPPGAASAPTGNRVLTLPRLPPLPRFPRRPAPITLPGDDAQSAARPQQQQQQQQQWQQEAAADSAPRHAAAAPPAQVQLAPEAALPLGALGEWWVALPSRYRVLLGGFLSFVICNMVRGGRMACLRQLAARTARGPSQGAAGRRRPSLPAPATLRCRARAALYMDPCPRVSSHPGGGAAALSTPHALPIHPPPTPARTKST